MGVIIIRRVISRIGIVQQIHGLSQQIVVQKREGALQYMERRHFPAEKPHDNFNFTNVSIRK